MRRTVGQGRHLERRRPERLRGFTLVELVVVIVITAIVATFVAIFLTTPVQSYFAQTQRGNLTATANFIQRNLSLDVVSALPGSLRKSGTALEMLEVADVGLYWGRRSGGPPFGAAPPNGAPAFAAGTVLAAFSTLGQFSTAGNGAYYIAEGFLNQSDAYTQTGVMTPPLSVAITPNTAASDTVTVTSGGPVTFATLSPTRHVFLISGPISYLCSLATRTLTRYDRYAVTATQMTTAAQFAAAGARSALIAQGVTRCPLTVTNATVSSVDSISWQFVLASGSAAMTTWTRVAVGELP